MYMHIYKLISLLVIFGDKVSLVAHPDLELEIILLQLPECWY
jgi:hypothetical protein